MRAVVAEMHVSWRRRPDGVPEILRRPLGQVLAAEVVTLASLCTAAALLGATLAGWLGVLLPATILAAYARAQLWPPPQERPLSVPSGGGARPARGRASAGHPPAAC